MALSAAHTAADITALVHALLPLMKNKLYVPAAGTPIQQERDRHAEVQIRPRL